MDNMIPPTHLPKRPTPLEEYRRAVAVQAQWRALWDKTRNRRHLSAALTCQRMAQDWLKIAVRQRQISDAEFRRENNKLTVPKKLELA